MDYFDNPTLRGARTELYQELSAIKDEVNVYYLVPLSNLKSILDDGGIKCRNDPSKEGIDLSGYGVQTRRNKNIDLGCNEDIINKEIHDCINFFLNPDNSTLFAFQRKSLLKNAVDNTYGIVCILEMRLSDFFETDNMYWCISNKNLASSGFKSGFLKKDYEKFKWRGIFHDKDEGNSAEFIVYYENPGFAFSNLIPISFIKRILVSKQHEIIVKENTPLAQDKIHSLKNNTLFKPATELLNYEIKLVGRNIMKLDEIGISTEEFCDLINTFLDFGKALGCAPTEEHFESIDTANSHHGIGHTIRVMFWIHVLCYLSRISPPIEETTQYAAFIHDLCFEHNDNHHRHGENALLKHRYFIEKHVQHNHIDDCKRAVVYHCKDDEAFRNKSLVWELLKDADSLDRGRFGPPNTNIRSKGCDVNYLRLNIFKDSAKLKEKLAWMAYWLARITHHTAWSIDPFTDFKNEIKTSLKACLMNDILKPNEKTIVKEIVDNI